MSLEESASSPPEVSVVLSTYNRSDRLGAALSALLAQTGDVPYEIIVVDNNSTDDTAAVVHSIVRNWVGRVRYTFEPRQGLSHGRNAGIALARSPIVAFTDDDVRVSGDWIFQIKRGFDAHLDAGYIGGRVLPHWLATPPSWLTTAHWAPLALQDYGTDTHVSGRERAVCLVGANLAFRKQVFARVGMFTTSLGRVKDGIGSTEDHDMQLRAWRAGIIGLYLPSVVAVADVTADRLEKGYHRRWHHGHGRHCAMMRLRELVPADLGPMSEPNDIVTLFGAPAFVYADLLRTAALWVKAVCRRGDSRFYLHQFLHLWSYLGASRHLAHVNSNRSVPSSSGDFYGCTSTSVQLIRRRSRTTEQDFVLQSWQPGEAEASLIWRRREDGAAMIGNLVH